jgi:hypothetical protein
MHYVGRMQSFGIMKLVLLGCKGLILSSYLRPCCSGNRFRYCDWDFVYAYFLHEFYMPQGVYKYI